MHLHREDATVNNEMTARKAVGIGRVLNCLANASSRGNIATFKKHQLIATYYAIRPII